MRSLFLKIFGWFWFTVIAVGVAITASVLYSSRALETQKADLISAVFRTEAGNLAEIMVRDGRPAVAKFIDRLEKKYPVRAYFFSVDDVRFFDVKRVPRDVQKMALFAIREDGLHVAGNLASQRIATPDGQTDALVIAMSTSPELIKSEFLLYEAPLIILIAGGLFCFLLTRHITAPLVRLSAAAQGIASGRLDTRVGKDLRGRRDEIGGLGRDFDRMAERIEALMTGQQNLLGNISHELRSPLARLNVALGILKRDRPEPESECVVRIALEAQRLDKLIGQLLMLSRLDSKVFDGVGDPVDLTTLTHEVVSDADFEARSTSRRVQADTLDTCIIVGHQDLLRSAIENVVRNAVRHTPQNTSVDVSLHRGQSTGESRAILRVRDRGPGVSESMLPEIFRPFTRVPSKGEPDGAGAGLGLAIAQRAVVAHGGSITARNAPDGGLVMEIELPMNDTDRRV